MADISKELIAQNLALKKKAEAFEADIIAVSRRLKSKINKMLVDFAAQKQVSTVDLEFALELKTQMGKLLREAGYYISVDDALGQYGTIIRDIHGAYGDVVKGITFSEVDKKIMQELIKTDLSLFNGLARDATDAIYKSMANSLLTPVSIESGVAAVAAALEDSPLQKYAYTYLNTAYMDFHRTINNITSQNAGFTEYEYVGPDDDKTREFCHEWVGKTLSIDEVKSLKNDQGGDSFSEGGGYNCRHTWIGVVDSISDAVQREGESEDEFAARQAAREEAQRILDERRQRRA
jgi:hypothetical protein